MKTSILQLFFILCFSMLSPTLLQGQGIIPQKSVEEVAEIARDSVVLRPFPAARITEAFSATGNQITQSARLHLTRTDIASFSIELDTLLSEIQVFMGDSVIQNIEELGIRELETIVNQARVLISELDDMQDRLSVRALEIESESQLLWESKERWRLTLDAQVLEETPESRVERIGRTMFRLDSVRSLLQQDVALMLEGQDQLADKKLILQDLVNDVRDRIAVLGKNLLNINAPGFFEELSMRDQGLLKSHFERLTSNVQADYHTLRTGFRRPFTVAGLILILLIVFSLWFKKNYEELITTKDFRLTEVPRTIINSPVATSIILVTLVMRLVLPGLPTTFFALNLLILLIPLAILAIRLFGPDVRVWIILLVALYGLEIPYELSYHDGPVQRILQMGVCLAEIWLFIWVIRKKPFEGRIKNKNVYGLYKAAMVAFVILPVLAILANLVGALRLSEFISFLPLEITLSAIAMIIFTRMVDAIFYLLLSSNLLQNVNVIKEDAAYIHKRIVRLSNVFFALFFLVVLLRILMLKDAVFAWGSEVLTEDKKFWNINFSLANILIFFFVIWLSIMLAKIITRILERDVFTRVTTTRGMPQTIVMLLRVALITGGFFLAAGAAGMELDNLAIVLGAFSVGIGFGLQNIFNNMVSGLILAFERPIKVGDVVQVGELMGTVKSIGFRSSNVRSFDGAEVIVPNGNLISNQMINWTKSDYYRRMDIRVGVAYGTDPEVVIALMEETAAEYTEVRTNPKPRGYFLEFGDSSLNFRLLAWVHLDVRLETESELKVAINRKLKEAGIEIPFPQRDLHIRSDATQILPKPKPPAGGKK